MGDAADKYRIKVPTPDTRGIRNGHAKLNPDSVREIRRRIKEGGVSQTQLAREYDVAKSQISMVVNRKTWSHVE